MMACYEQATILQRTFLEGRRGTRTHCGHCHGPAPRRSRSRQHAAAGANEELANIICNSSWRDNCCCNCSPLPQTHTPGACRTPPLRVGGFMLSSHLLFLLSTYSLVPSFSNRPPGTNDRGPLARKLSLQPRDLEQELEGQQLAASGSEDRPKLIAWHRRHQCIRA